MIYTNSEGVQCDTASMDKNHLVNALIKAARLTETIGADTDDRDAKMATAKANLSALKAEALIRIK